MIRWGHKVLRMIIWHLHYYWFKSQSRISLDNPLGGQPYRPWKLAISCMSMSHFYSSLRLNSLDPLTVPPKKNKDLLIRYLPNVHMTATYIHSTMSLVFLFILCVIFHQSQVLEAKSLVVILNVTKTNSCIPHHKTRISHIYLFHQSPKLKPYDVHKRSPQ